MDGVNGTACHRPTSTSRQFPESSHPPAALTAAGDAGSIRCDGDNEALGALGDVDPDGLAAPTQLAMANATIAVAAIDRFIG